MSGRHPPGLYALRMTELGETVPAGLYVNRIDGRYRDDPEIELHHPLPARILAHLYNDSFNSGRDKMELPAERSDRYDVVRMRGSYLENEDVRDGDYLILEYAEPEDGELAYCLVEDDEEDFHTFREYRDGDPPVVVHSPPRLDPVKRPASEVEIVGRVVGVIRKY